MRECCSAVNVFCVTMLNVLKFVVVLTRKKFKNNIYVCFGNILQGQYISIGVGNIILIKI